MKRRAALAAMLAGLAAPAIGVRPRDGPRRVVTLSFFPLADQLAAELRKLGWSDRDLRVEGVVVPLESDRLDHEAARIVASKPDVLVGQRSNYVGALARATRTIPIVSGGIADPVAEGVARSLRVPGGNVTGLSNALPEAAALQLGTLREVVPLMKRVVFVSADASRRGALPPAHVRVCATLGIACTFVTAPSRAAFEDALAALRPEAGDTLWVGDIPPDADAKAIAELAIRRGLPTIAQNAAVVNDGVLFSVWLQHSHIGERTAAIVHRILRGEDPAAIPFELPDSSDFRLNRTTARRLGLKLSDALMLRVTELVD